MYFIKKGKIMNIEIEKISFYRIAYIRQIGSYGQNNVKTIENLKKWAMSNGLINNQSIILGIARDNPKIA
ncbi:MAG: DNA gyrase inhibitor GyrI [Clostridium sp.]|jgi:DNA gyrase inhibitor GyrI